MSGTTSLRSLKASSCSGAPTVPSTLPISRPLRRSFSGTMTSWRRAYTACSKPTCNNWIWQDKQCPGTRCRRCGTMWSSDTPNTGKGKGFFRSLKSSELAWERPYRMTRTMTHARDPVYNRQPKNKPSAWTRSRQDISNEPSRPYLIEPVALMRSPPNFSRAFLRWL